MFNQSEEIESKRLFEGNKQEVINLLQEELELFNPALGEFVDDDYRTVIAKIGSNGICKFVRQLTKNKDPLGKYSVK